MATKTYCGKAVSVNDEGYFTDPSEWTKEIGAEIAREVGLELTEKHFEVIDYLRKRVMSGEQLTIRSVGKSGIVDIKQFYELFPGAPLKKATKIAGLPKPTSCV
jgi:tRNA 2-thiouridine synthesizing protein E